MQTLENQVTSTLQNLIAGDRNKFIFIPTPFTTSNVDKQEVLRFLINLHDFGYGISNAHVLLELNKINFNRFKSEFLTYIKSNIKEGMIFRKTFGDKKKLTPYTTEEWLAIFAQYSITYGWPNEYQGLFGVNPSIVLDKYVGSMSDKITKLKGTKRVIEIGDYTDLVEILRNISTQTSVLRSQQIETLKNSPSNALVEAIDGYDIPIKETRVMLMKLTKGHTFKKPLLKTATDVLRFIVSEYAHESYEGVLINSKLQKTKLRIPTSARKMILLQLELIAKNRKAKGEYYLAEDMFSYSSFWKQVNRYLRYEKQEAMRKKYPLYTLAIDLLYKGDRSWTFNSRFSNAKENQDYASAVLIASEKPGFLLRNLLDFLTKIKGAKIPVKIDTKKNKNAFQDALQRNRVQSNVVKTDAVSFFKSKRFEKILNDHLNPKIAWQLIEKLQDEELYKPQYVRVVQGVTVKYSTPIPGLNVPLTKYVQGLLMNTLKAKLQYRNKDIGLVYIDKDAKKYAIQYSGRKSTEITYSGEYLSKGTSIDFSEIVGSNNVKNPVLRMGVMWRATEKKKQSIDLDHNFTVKRNTNETEVLYYGKPELKGRNGNIIGVSSGDITSNGDHNSAFSCEMIDININDMLANGFETGYNSIINYNGVVGIGSLEAYFFFSLIDKKDRLIKGNNIEVDLAQMDYAIRIDPENKDNTGSYIGFLVNFKKQVIEVLAEPVFGENNSYSNAITNLVIFEKVMKNRRLPLTVGYTLKQALSESNLIDVPEMADVIISKTQPLNTTATWIHPGRDFEKINQMIF